MNPKVDLGRYSYELNSTRCLLLKQDNLVIPLSDTSSLPLISKPSEMADFSSLYISQDNLLLKAPAISFATEDAVFIMSWPVKVTNTFSGMSKKFIVEATELANAYNKDRPVLPKIVDQRSSDVGLISIDQLGREYHILPNGGFRLYRAFNFLEATAILLSETVPLPAEFNELALEFLEAKQASGAIKSGVFHSTSGLIYFGEE